VIFQDRQGARNHHAFDPTPIECDGDIFPKGLHFFSQISIRYRAI
jgi:hypothetical protein